MVTHKEFEVSNPVLKRLSIKRIAGKFHARTTNSNWFAIILLLFFAVVAEAQQLKLQGVSSGGHVNSTNGTIKLSGSFGVPFAHSSATLKGGIIGAASGLLLENTPPSILHTAISSFDFGPPVSVSVSAVVTDIDNVEYVALRIRPIGGPAFDSIPMPKGTGDNYSVSIGNKFDEMGFEYYLVARDLTLKRGRLPATGSYYAYAKINGPTVPPDRVKYGKQQEDYRIITVPYMIGQNLVASLFAELNAFDNENGSQWRLFSHEGGSVFNEFPGGFQTLGPGRGYWLLINDDNPVALKLSNNDEQSPEYNQTKLFEITLKPGWNMIGNPYTVEIDWSDVQDYNPSVALEDLKVYNGTYLNSDKLQPFEGGFVQWDGAANQQIEISFPGQNPGGRKGNSFSSDLSSENWKLNLELHQGDRHSTLGGIGMHTDASINKDRYDDHNPPRFQSYLEVNFNHPEHPLGSFSRDIVPTQDKYKWTFTADASDQSPVFLQWDNQGMGDNDIGLYLYEPGSASLVNMRYVNSYAVTQHSAIQIFYGRNAEEDIAPEFAVAGKAFPNPFNGNISNEVVFPIALPASPSEYQVHIEVLDSRGQHIKNVLSEKLPSGFHEAQWQVDDEQGNTCIPGMYVYRITLSNGVKRLSTTGKLIITN